MTAWALWDSLARHWLFSWQYFEVCWPAVVYTACLLFFCGLERWAPPGTRTLHLHPAPLLASTPHPLWSTARDAALYMTPVFLIEASKGPRVEMLARAGPPAPWLVALQVAGALVVFDTLFFWQHVLYHRSPTLYQWIHGKHHCHSQVVHPAHTNMLTAVERCSLPHPLPAFFLVFPLCKPAENGFSSLPVFSWCCPPQRP